MKRFLLGTLTGVLALYLAINASFIYTTHKLEGCLKTLYTDGGTPEIVECVENVLATERVIKKTLMFPFSLYRNR